MSGTIVIGLLELISKFVPKTSINRVVISPRSRRLVQLYESLPKPNKPKIYQIADDVLIEVNLLLPGERAISFHAFEPTVTKRFLKMIKKGDVVIDLGAWIGYYSLLAAGKVGDKGRVISIEPHRTNYERIESNIHLNNFKNVELLNLAVGDQLGTVVLKEGNDSLTHTITGNEIGHQTRIDTVDNILKSLGVEYVSVIIMDIEGYEYFALKGAKDALAKGCIKNIICEVHPNKLRLNGYTDTDVIKYLSSHGYKIEKLTTFDTCYHIHART